MPEPTPLVKPEPDDPSTLATPEGDAEDAPDQPLKPVVPDALETPRGSKPDAYRQPDAS